MKSFYRALPLIALVCLFAIGQSGNAHAQTCWTITNSTDISIDFVIPACPPAFGLNGDIDPDARQTLCEASGSCEDFYLIVDGVRVNIGENGAIGTTNYCACWDNTTNEAIIYEAPCVPCI